jgi:hypothetical protein
MNAAISIEAWALMLGFAMLCALALGTVSLATRKYRAMPTGLVGALLGALLCFILIEALPTLV